MCTTVDDTHYVVKRVTMVLCTVELSSILRYGLPGRRQALDGTHHVTSKTGTVPSESHLFCGMAYPEGDERVIFGPVLGHWADAQQTVAPGPVL